MAGTAYYPGEQVRVKCEFRVDDVLTDPTGVVFKYKPPVGAIVTYTYGTDPELVKASTGTYHVDLTLTDDGKWEVRFEGTGAVVAAVEGIVKVASSVFV